MAPTHPRQVDREQSAERISARLTTLYGKAEAEATLPSIMEIVDQKKRIPEHPPLTERDLLVIAYADHVQSDATPLNTLLNFATSELEDMVSGIHILPFYPATSDGGFAVADYDSVSSNFGTWSDIDAIANNFRLMADCVINHCSASHPWFQEFLAGNPSYGDYFIVESPDFDTSKVVRPRSTPLYTKFESASGVRNVWTTFGPDQIDLNYRCPALLVEVVRIIANYISHGASMLRFDATHFVWKESATSCVNLPQTHEIVKLLRDVIDAIDPSVVIVNETNVPHAENITYLGDGHDEAQLVYNFALPSLLAHTIISENSEVLTDWASRLETPSTETCFFNYSACHDGISLRGASQILDADDLQQLVHTAVEHGAQILYRGTPHGEAPYELCISYFDILSDPHGDPNIDRFILSQAVVLALAGVPAMYFANFIGAPTLPPTSGPGSHPRDVIREKYRAEELVSQLDDLDSRPGKVFNRLRTMLAVRRSEPAFHPNGEQKVLHLGPHLFGLERTSVDATRTVTAVFNVSSESRIINFSGTDLLTGEAVVDETRLSPFGFLWLLS